ncbi:hypothetical protein GH714_013132 [Hevea brasiliensis]|uniref:Uncharacterized protein n=1 Tax=Hevea brasiliensis TaxID=3981 RepID=A0A6A6N885_HEVBR|nr:hypothetical protein GH714_013132 [Hevea brasiliensis]
MQGFEDVRWEITLGSTSNPDETTEEVFERIADGYELPKIPSGISKDGKIRSPVKLVLQSVLSLAKMFFAIDSPAHVSSHMVQKMSYYIQLSYRAGQQLQQYTIGIEKILACEGIEDVVFLQPQTISSKLVIGAGMRTLSSVNSGRKAMVLNCYILSS